MWVPTLAAALVVAILFGWWRTHRRLIALERNVQQALTEIQGQLKVTEEILPELSIPNAASASLTQASREIIEATSVYEKSIAERALRDAIMETDSIGSLSVESAQKLRATQDRLDLVEDFYNQTVLMLNHSATHFPTSWVASLDRIPARPVIPIISAKPSVDGET